MSLVTMPNGEVVDIDDNASPDVVAKIKSQYQPTRQQRVAAGQPRVSAEQAQIQKEAQQRVAMQLPGDPAQNSIMDAMTFGLADKIGAGVEGLYKGIYHDVTGSGPGIVDTYNHRRAVQQQVNQINNNQHPYQTLGGDVVGAVLNPIGDAAALAKGGGTLLARAGASTAGKAVTGVGTRLAESGAIPQAIASGATQGALNAAGHSDSLSDVPGNLVEGAGIGALTGGLVGGAAHLGAKGVQALVDANPANAERTAYMRVADLLGKGKVNPEQATELGVAPGTRWTPDLARREIQATDAAGGDAMMQDITPGLQARAANLSIKPDLENSADLINRGEQRITDRRANFGQQVVNSIDNLPAGGVDALSRGDTLAATRKGMGQMDYAKGGVMDTPIDLTPDLEQYLAKAPPQVQDAMKSARAEMLLRDENPNQYVGENGVFTHIPNLRTFDYVKRGFNTQIGQALQSGDKATAQGLSYQLDKLKGVLSDANPNDDAYQQILKSQRDLFQQQNALETGQQSLRRIVTEPRLLMRDLNALPDHAKDDARIGILDALINSDNKADPVQFYRNISRNDNQKKVLQFAFGGQGNLGRFDRWVGRESRAAQGDKFTSVGRQSGTARYAEGGGDDSSPTRNVLLSAFRGFGFGGATGAIGNTINAIQRVATGTSRASQEEIAKILLSKGETLGSGASAAAQYQAGRTARNVKRAVDIARGVQQPYTNAIGGK